MPFCSRCGNREYYCSKCGQLEYCNCNDKSTSPFNSYNFNQKKHICIQYSLSSYHINKGKYSESNGYCTYCGMAMPDTEYCPDCGQNITPEHNCSESNFKSFKNKLPHICPKRKFY